MAVKKKCANCADLHPQGFIQFTEKADKADSFIGESQKYDKNAQKKEEISHSIGE